MEQVLRRSPAIGIKPIALPSTREADLIRTARRGNLEAFNELVLLYQDRVYGLAYHILGDSAAAADATQEAFISAYRHIRSFYTGSFKAWLLRIVANACYDAIRYDRRRSFISLDGSTAHQEDGELDVPAHEDGPEAIVQQRELAEVIQRGIASLPMDQRTVLVLRDVQDLPYEEIAAITRSSLGTVKSRLSRARIKLRVWLTGIGLTSSKSGEWRVPVQ